MVPPRNSDALLLLAETDILVVGSGPAGLAAALGAAREGLDTMLVEHYGCFGGAITQVGVEGIAWHRHEVTIDAEGIGTEFERRAKDMGGERVSLTSQSQPLDTELFKCVADKLVQEAGIVPLLHCLAVGALMEGNTIRGIVTECKSGRQASRARRVIDATGDADIRYVPGFEYARLRNLGMTLGIRDSRKIVGRYNLTGHDVATRRDSKTPSASSQSFSTATECWSCRRQRDTFRFRMGSWCLGK